jgi:hypothetical protein
MGSTTAIAIYAAVVATAGVAWQVYTWLRLHGTRVRVTVSNAFLTFPDHLPQVAMITVRNLGGHPIRVTSAGFDFQDGSGRTVVLTQPPPGASLPGIVQPRDSAETWVEEQHFTSSGIDVFRPLVAWARLATGETFKSKPTTLMRHDAGARHAA